MNQVLFLSLVMVVCMLGLPVFPATTTSLNEQSVIHQATDTANKRKLEQIEVEKTVIKMMTILNTDISDSEKAVITSTLASIAMNTFDNKAERESWIGIIAIESGFNGDAESPAGAVGIGQITFLTAKDRADSCGFRNIVKDDLWNITINASLSACLFKGYIEKFDSVNLAEVAYNAGAYTKDIKRLKNVQGINTESANYIARLSIILEKIRK